MILPLNILAYYFTMFLISFLFIFRFYYLYNSLNQRYIMKDILLLIMSSLILYFIVFLISCIIYNMFFLVSILHLIISL